jgi:hypothetical protein
MSSTGCGHIAFGPQDGMLYLCVGDTQDNQEIRPVSQDPAGSLGRILRFDVHAPMIAEAEAGGPIAAYASPPPFGGPETVAYGLRNPWRFDFDPASGGMFIPDVGRWNSEELNFLPADHAPSPNLGWPQRVPDRLRGAGRPHLAGLRIHADRRPLRDHRRRNLRRDGDARLARRLRLRRPVQRGVLGPAQSRA